MPVQLWEKAAEWGPGWVAIIAVIFGIWRAGKWLGLRLFDKDDGLLTLFFAKLQSHLDQQAANHQSLLRIMDTNTQSIREVERRMSAAAATNLSGEEMDSLAQLLMTELPVPLAQVAEDGHHLRTNDAFRTMVGYSAEELAGLTFQDLTPSAGDLAADIEGCRQLVLGLIKTHRIEKQIRRKDGSSIYVALYSFRFPQAGPFRFFMSCIIPLTPPHSLR